MAEEKRGTSPQRGIFDGVRVIDFTHVLAGPYCTKLMTDLGADVIKIEPPGYGELGRVLPYVKDGASAFYMYRNAGKRSLCLDMRQLQAVEVFKDLVKVSDVLVQNRKVGAMERLGVGWEDLKKINPKLVMCSISGYGQYGPLSDWPANDINIQAMSGVMALNGHPDGPPLPCWVPWVDFATGTHSFGAVSAALYHVKMTGEGQHIDVSMMDCAFSYHDFAIEEYFATNGEIERGRSGAMHPTLALLGVFKCQDGHLIVSATNEEAWPKLCELMDRPELAKDPRFDVRLHRDENKDEVNRLISEWIKDFTVDDAKIILEQNGIVAVNILSISQVANHPHVEARELLVEMDDPRLGKIKLPSTPFKFSGTLARVRGRAPMLGEHNEELLSSVIGYSKEQIDQLWERKVIFAEPAAR